jgi:hypothetical protein
VARPGSRFFVFNTVLKVVSCQDGVSEIKRIEIQLDLIVERVSFKSVPVAERGARHDPLLIWEECA